MYWIMYNVLDSKAFSYGRRDKGALSECISPQSIPLHKTY